MKFKTIIRISFLLVLCSMYAKVSAVTYYWVKNTAASWTSGSSWSLTSGGAPLAVAFPSAAGDIAIFNGGGIGNCAINTPLNINSVSMNAGYTGTLSNSGFTTTLGGNFTIASGTFNLGPYTLNITGFFSQTGGTFNGNNGSIAIIGNFTKTLGTHNATSNIMSVGGDFNVGTNTFNHNGGTVLFSGANPIVNIVSPLAFVTISPLTTTSLNVTGVLTALGTFRLLGTGMLRIMGGTVDAYSDVLLNNTATTGGGTGTVRMVGSGSHSFISSVPIGQCRLPNVTVAMTGGNFAFNGSVSIAGSFLYDPPGTVGCSAIHAVGATVAFTGAGVTVNCVDLVSMGNTFIFFPHVVVMSGSSVTLASPFDCNNLTLQNGGTLDVSISNYFLGVAGDWLNQNTTAASFNERNGSVRMILGSITSSVTGGESFYQLILNNASGSAWITLNSRVNIIFQLRDDLNFGLNVMFTSAAAPLVFLDNATMWYSSPEWMTLVVIGPIIKIGDDAFSFPTGAQIGFQFYPRPITISAPVLTTDEFKAQYYAADADPLYDNALRVPSLITLSSCEYWTLNRTVGSSSVNVTLSWLSSATPACTVISPAHMVVAGWNGIQWLNHGQSTNAGNPSLGSVTTLVPVSTFGPFTLGSIGTINPLPIELISFDAQPVNHSVELSWQTASETNNDYFTIERSVDGTTVESIDTVDGAGNSTTVKDYHTSDPAPYDGMSYYRLKQVDFNGHSSYSDWKMVYVETAVDITVYPNPSDGNISINLTGESDALWTMTIMDLSGKIVLEQTGPKTVFQSIYVDLSQGSYILRLDSSAGTYSQFMTITD